MFQPPQSKARRGWSAVRDQALVDLGCPGDSSRQRLGLAAQPDHAYPPASAMSHARAGLTGPPRASVQ